MYTHVSKCKNDKIKGEKCYFNSGKKKKKKKGKKKKHPLAFLEAYCWLCWP
jgi:hypothetical protein